MKALLAELTQVCPDRFTINEFDLKHHVADLEDDHILESDSNLHGLVWRLFQEMREEYIRAIEVDGPVTPVTDILGDFLVINVAKDVSAELVIRTYIDVQRAKQRVPA